MLNTKIASRKPDSSGRIDVTAARLRLNLADPADVQVHGYVQELKEKRECKAAMMRGLELEYNLRNRDFDAICQGEPELVQFILSRYGESAPAAPPQSIELPDPPTERVEPESAPLDEPDFENFEF